MLTLGSSLFFAAGSNGTYGTADDDEGTPDDCVGWDPSSGLVPCCDFS